jgi:hypothetical protein
LAAVAGERLLETRLESALAGVVFGREEDAGTACSHPLLPVVDARVALLDCGWLRSSGLILAKGILLNVIVIATSPWHRDPILAEVMWHRLSEDHGAAGILGPECG